MSSSVNDDTASYISAGEMMIRELCNDGISNLQEFQEMCLNVDGGAVNADGIFNNIITIKKIEENKIKLSNQKAVVVVTSAQIGISFNVLCILYYLSKANNENCIIRNKIVNGQRLIVIREVNKLKSTNDFILKGNDWKLTVAMAVLAAQNLVLALVVYQKFVDGANIHNALPLVTVKVMIAVYVALEVTKHFSSTLFETMEDYIGVFNKERCRNGQEFFLKKCFPALLIPFLLPIYSFYTKFSNKNAWPSIIITAEISSLILMATATTLVVRSEESIIEMLLNFAGLLLVLQLDELVALHDNQTITRYVIRTLPNESELPNASIEEAHRDYSHVTVIAFEIYLLMVFFMHVTFTGT